MIQLTRLNGADLGINADLIEKVESNPDTVLTLVGGSKYLVAETPAEVIERVVDYRAHIIREARSENSPVRLSSAELHVLPTNDDAEETDDAEEAEAWTQ